MDCSLWELIFKIMDPSLCHMLTLIHLSFKKGFNGSLKIIFVEINI